MTQIPQRRPPLGATNMVVSGTRQNFSVGLRLRTVVMADVMTHDTRAVSRKRLFSASRERKRTLLAIGFFEREVRGCDGERRPVTRT